MILFIVQGLVFISLALSVYMMAVTLERCRSEKRYGFVYCVFTIFLYTLGYLIEISCGNTGGAVVAVKIMYAGACFMSPFFFFFVAEYCELRIPKKYYFAPLLIIPALNYGVVISFDHHELLYLSYFYDTSKTIQSLSIVPGPLYPVNIFYPLLCVALSCIVLIRSILTQSRGQRLGLVLLLISALAPLAANFFYVTVSYFIKTPLAGINFTAFFMIISNFIFYYNVMRKDMFDLAPKANAITMDMIMDAVIIVDRNMAYTGSNKKARELFPALADLQKGALIENLRNWPRELSGEFIKTNPEDYTGRGIEFTINHKPGRTYSGWKNLITSETGTTLGWIILIKDITETVELIRNIRARHDEIAVMRDNLKEGIFLMNSQFVIQDSYSKAMEEVLSCRDLQAKRFTDLLGKSYSSRDLEIIADYFNMITNQSVSPEMLDDMNPLGEFSYTSIETGEQKTLRCHFAPVDQGGGAINVMGTIQDISAEITLKKQLNEEEERRQEEMRSLFDVMQVDKKVIMDFIEDSEYEILRAKETLLNGYLTPEEKLINLYQSVHAVKSNALIVDLTSYGMELHTFETKIKKLLEKEGGNDYDDIQIISEELDKHIEGKEKIIEIVKRLSNYSTAASVRRDDEVFIDALSQACRKVAADENKKVILTAETFDREALDKGPRRLMKDILTQLVRNAVHHGIESPEERLARGKDETGKITLKVSLEKNSVRMVLSDNGHGLDYDRIAETAWERGLLDNIPKEEINQSFLSNLIFSPGFSTSVTEDIHAGRGIGLNLVRDRLKEVHGKIRIQSKKGLGLTFDIQIPISN